MADIVIGTGPSGYAAIRARLELGRSVTVIDVGNEIDPKLDANRAMLAATVPSAWHEETVAAFRAAQKKARGGIARFGSDHAVRPMTDVVDADDNAFRLRSSHALGGLSNVWGSAVLPWSADDIRDWPISHDDLRAHYKAVSSFVPIAGTGDGLTDIFDFDGFHLSEPLPRNAQSEFLLARLSRLDASSIHAGPSLQCVAPNCRACGLCLYGCPYGLIFSTVPPIRDLIAQSSIKYVRGEAIGLRETETGVEVDVKGRTDPVVGDRVFVAAGVLETTRLLFRSNGDFADRGLALRESRHFFTPFLHAGRARGSEDRPHHTLAMAFLEMKNQDISPHLIHTQIYGWNDFYGAEMMDNYGKGVTLLEPVFRWLAKRFFAAQTFLHSDHCHRIELRPAGDVAGRLKASLIENSGSEKSIRMARNEIATYLRKAGLHAAGRGVRLEPPGASFHTGATLPMSKRPGARESDVLGRPRGSLRIHIVDASVLPDIPATTITFPVMANAHRIASQA